jgi:hypothetical protein
MLPAVEKITAVQGVLGMFTTSPGRLRASTLPGFLPSDSLHRVAEPLLAAWDLAERQAMPVGDMVLHFGDTRVVVARVSPNCLLLVVCQHTVDMIALTELLRALEPEYETIASWQMQKERSGSAAGQGFFRLGSGGGDDFIRRLTATGLTIPGRKSPPASGAAEKSMVEPGAANEMPRAPRTSLTEEDRSRLGEILSHYVGPVASLLIASALRSRTTPRDVVERLSREIESPRDRVAFLSEAQRIVDGH